MTSGSELDFGGFYRGKRVLVTGHTGFKGAWLSSWLLELGAEVIGYADRIPSQPSLFETLALEGRLRHVIGDVRDLGTLSRLMKESRPQVLFHLAAQALVRASYRTPVETFATNVLGTAHVLEAARACPDLRAIVNVTSDKCYENRDWPLAYRENDPMGGADPYSASKGCAELVFASYVRSFLHAGPQRAASARAGNVIGGGDWSEDRLIPDCVRAWSKGHPVSLRNPASIRPWQHVLEPLSGYLLLGARLASGDAQESCHGEAFNFGPGPEAFEPVERVVLAFREHWPGVRYELLPRNEAAAQPHEARVLKLSNEKAGELLRWRPTLGFSETLALTADWYRAFYARDDALAQLTRTQIKTFAQQALLRNVRLAADAGS